MADVATLGLAVDSSQLKVATGSLNQFAASANTAAQAGAKIETQNRATETATKKLAASTAELDARAKATSSSFSQQVQRVSQVEKATVDAMRANDNYAKSAGLARFELINLSRQAQDVVVSLAGGQGLGTVLLQQGSQIGDVFASSKVKTGDALKSILSGVLGLISPMRLLVGGAAAAAAAGYFIFENWKKTELQFKSTADQVGLTTKALHGLDNNATPQGLSTADLLTGLSKFNEGVFDAQRGLGDLRQIFAANGKEAKTFEDYLLGASDIIKNTATDQGKLNQLQQLGLPATSEWVKFLSQGSSELRRAIEQGSRFNAEAEGMARRAADFDEKWNKTVKNLKDSFNSWFVDSISWFGRLADAGTGALMKINAMLPKTLQTDFGGNFLKRAAANNMGDTLTQSTANKFYDSVGLAGNDNRSSVDLDGLRKQLALQKEQQSVMGSAVTIGERYNQQRQELNVALQSGVLNQTQYNKALGASRLDEEKERLSTRVSVLATVPSVAQLIASAKEVQQLKPANNAGGHDVSDERRLPAAA